MNLERFNSTSISCRRHLIKIPDSYVTFFNMYQLFRHQFWDHRQLGLFLRAISVPTLPRVNLPHVRWDNLRPTRLPAWLPASFCWKAQGVGKAPTYVCDCMCILYNHNIFINILTYYMYSQYLYTRLSYQQDFVYYSILYGHCYGLCAVCLSYLSKVVLYS